MKIFTLSLSQLFLSTLCMFLLNDGSNVGFLAFGELKRHALRIYIQMF